MEDEMLLIILYDILPKYKNIAKENYLIGFYTKLLDLKVKNLDDLSLIEKQKLLSLLDIIQLEESSSICIKIESLKDTLKDLILLVRNTF